VDERVGMITGYTKYTASLNGRVMETASLYARLEKFAKIFESRIGSCAGADGAVFAIRKALFIPMRSFDINDLVIPLMIVRQGFRGVLEESAFCREEVPGEMRGEFQRQVRITNRSLRALFNYRDLLNPLRYPLFSFVMISHKLLKYMTPFFVILIFFSNVALALSEGFYALVFGFQVICYLLVYVGYRNEKKGNTKGLPHMAYSFALVSLAMLKGWVTCLAGKTYAKWSPERA
jgi:cellulose synthase/poly-beta-1,6-N-acetylglucosamine synthase-like glycosyltransferase